MIMYIFYMYVIMDLMYIIVYFDILVIMDFMFVIYLLFYFLYDL